MSASTETQYRLPEPIRKTNDLYRLLAGNELLGLAPGEIAKALNVSPSWVSVTLPALAAQSGFVEQVEGTNRWRLSVAFVRISMTVMTNLSKAKAHLEEVSHRYSVPI